MVSGSHDIPLLGKISMQQELGVERQDTKVSSLAEEPAGRWSARRMILVVSALSLLVWIVLIVVFFGL